MRPSGTGADQELEREERFRELFNAYYHHVLGYALRRAASRDDAADVVAETFLVAWRRLDDLPSEALTRPWLYGVARRVLANQRRSTGRRELLAARLREVPRLPVIDAPLIEDLSEVGAVLQRLAPGDREILALHAWEGLGAQELAAALGCSSGAARVRLYRARRRFAQASADSDLSFVARTELTGPHTLRTRMSTEDSA